jgi:hypothetical protein
VGRRREETRLSHRFQDSSPRGYSSRERSRSSEHSKPFVPVVGTTRVVSSEYEEARGRNRARTCASAHRLWFKRSPQSANHRLPARDNSARECKDHSSLPGHSAGLFLFLGVVFQPIPTTTHHRGWMMMEQGGRGWCSVRSRGNSKSPCRRGLCFPPSMPWNSN